MIILQLLDSVPEWALRLGLDNTLFDLLEKCALNPENTSQILDHLEYEDRVKVLAGLKYAEDKGLNL